MPKAMLCRTYLLASSLQLLRQPLSRNGTLHRLGDAFGMSQHLTQVTPDQIIELVSSTEARGAFVLLAAVDRLGFRGTDVVVVAPFEVPGSAGGLAESATHQHAQEVGIH